MLDKAIKLGSPTSLLYSVTGFAYCSVVVFQANVMPHPPLRSCPTSAGATRTRPSSAGRERIPGPPVARGNYHQLSSSLFSWDAVNNDLIPCIPV